MQASSWMELQNPKTTTKKFATLIGSWIPKYRHYTPYSACAVVLNNTGANDAIVINCFYCDYLSRVVKSWSLVHSVVPLPRYKLCLHVFHAETDGSAVVHVKCKAYQLMFIKNSERWKNFKVVQECSWCAELFPLIRIQLEIPHGSKISKNIGLLHRMDVVKDDTNETKRFTSWLT